MDPEFNHPVTNKKTRIQQAAIKGFQVVQRFFESGRAQGNFFFKKIHHLSDKIQSLNNKKVLQSIGFWKDLEDNNNDLTSNNCNCDKIIKPTRKNRTGNVPNFRNLSYKPTKVHEKIKSTLLFSNQKYGYKLDMELPHNCDTLCSACNSQINRDIKAANKNRKFITISPFSSPTDNISLQSPTLSILSQVEFKLHMTIKQNKQMLPAIIVNFNLENPNFMIKLNHLSMNKLG
ncbi:hypothetical protein C1645_824710 [Glomus cerebriforme]|uniref:Uncharacterized protein n=1 Tax=Glomus cerebriforme TaxID=658196 RepID=A0A397STP3_9GLOM|nr:hypothetical protein C1645_824710 [Glomus cerebriforme]